MKVLGLIIALFCFGISAEAQLVNVNPDPNGEPWMVSYAQPTPPSEKL